MKIICVGRNYSAHAKELGNVVPVEPVIFMKPESALLAPSAAFYYPHFTKELHYECELVIRITKECKQIAENEAANYYDAITVGIDFTARDIQVNLMEKGLPWEKAKAFDNSAPLGKFIPFTTGMDINNIAFSLNKNGQQVQQGNSGEMLFKVHNIIAHISTYFTLNAGDVIFTGTPPGVGECAAGDELEAFIEGQSLLKLKIK